MKNAHLPPIQALILDWAGTTVDFGSRAPARVFVEIFRRVGIAISEADARGPMGRAKREHIAAILELPHVRADWEVTHGLPPTSADIDRLYADFLPLQKEVLAAHSDVIPGIPEMIEACRARGIKIGSTTGYTRDLIDIVAPRAAAAGYEADVTVCADDVPRGRPAPWMIFRAAESLGVYPTETIVCVDDTTVGIEAGRNAGTWTVGVTRTGNALGLSQEEIDRSDPHVIAHRLREAEVEFRAAGAHHVIESAADLLTVLAEIGNQRTSRSE